MLLVDCSHGLAYGCELCLIHCTIILPSAKVVEVCTTILIWDRYVQVVTTGLMDMDKVGK